MCRFASKESYPPQAQLERKSSKVAVALFFSDQQSHSSTIRPAYCSFAKPPAGSSISFSTREQQIANGSFKVRSGPLRHEILGSSGAFFRQKQPWTDSVCCAQTETNFPCFSSRPRQLLLRRRSLRVLSRHSSRRSCPCHSSRGVCTSCGI